MGFYYDDQMNRSDFTVRLYGNYSPSSGYDTSKPIATAIFSDNFEFEIGNSWSNMENSISNAIEAGWNKIKSFAPYAPTIENVFAKMKKMGAFEGGNSRMSRGLNSVANMIASGKGSEYLNKCLIVQGTRFIYFSGSNIEMGNMVMKYTIMHDPVRGSVKDQLSEIMPYCIGKFTTLNGKADDGLLSNIGWQDPPKGFKSSWRNVNNNLEGSLMLQFGNMFKIENLVVRSCSVSLSKVRVKSDAQPTVGMRGDPLYADVTLTFQVGGFITRKTLERYLGLPSSE